MLAVGLVVGPVASSEAAKKRTKSPSTKQFKSAVKRLDASIKALDKIAKDGRTAGQGVQALVPTFVKALGDLQAGLLALKSGLETAGAGLTTLGAAFKDQGTAAGTADPNVTQPPNNTTLPQGTIYRRLGVGNQVKSNAAGPTSTWIPSEVGLLTSVGTLSAQMAARPAPATGTGTPEGAVTAIVGTLYTDPANLTTAWIRHTGTGNTGWRSFTLAAP